ncbi:peroxisomal biogenesis factor 3 [Pyricularia oryzae Y34]|uniref:Peroxisomal biogenesis factor 3 n=2 Tax=Pyricularia oryzae TaxID=318829 RepID=A0AA97PRM8_PYRO3|nr:peroxisomal biogenesis factor 3 [Pyricularia oryzae Y34]KAI6316582.1 hypothetical protein MCOR30_009261 [Pyricularia oryzae]KAI6538801.1 hypothetical protein MCOR05_004836 [Pyricularia oryzae]KAI6569676.1 hypothetical protein MCOR09_005269 [Pyricularia oryzae]
MYSATRRWLRRNRTPIAVGAGVIGAGYLVSRYVMGKINDARERMSSDRIAKEKYEPAFPSPPCSLFQKIKLKTKPHGFNSCPSSLRRRFEQNQEDCTFTVLALLPTATQNVLEAMDTEKITYEIQQLKARPAGPPSIADTTLTEDDGRSVSASGPASSALATESDPQPQAAEAAAPANASRKTKRQLWDDLAISSIARAFTLLYVLALLTMLTRIQLNLLGRRSYLSSVITLATGSAQASIGLENNDDDSPDVVYGSDFDVNRRYLTFSWWLLNKGWAELRDRVEVAVRGAFGHLSPRDELSLDMFGRLTKQVRDEVEADVKWLAFLLPPRDQEDSVLAESGILGESETAAGADGSMIVVQSQSPVVPPPLRRLLDETSDIIDSPAFSHVLAKILDAGFSTLMEGELAQSVFGSGGVPKPTVQLPKVLSCLTRQAHAVGNGMPNKYLQAMETVRELEGFAAVVYSSNWQNEMRDDEGDAMAGSAAVIVPPTASFEAAWNRAVEGRQAS